MAMVFSVTSSSDDHPGFLQLSEAEGHDLLRWLELSPDPDGLGALDAVEIAARCRRRLWPEVRDRRPEMTTLTETFLRLAERAERDDATLMYAELGGADVADL